MKELPKWETFVAAVLLDAGWTQAQVGVEVGKDQKTVSRWLGEMPKWETCLPEQVQGRRPGGWRQVAHRTPSPAEPVASPLLI